ncbi:GIY-YIG nuclease family protein [candidate division Kazan bacterium]|uniref:GIY-YIG nuclease family protein n=1 Tax=candidate division Kazan bacterium TaxID=2202143 RepID=A0A420ZDF5_UNCK3|nr:MAG: GIY-YIG nuclease family protein [candidate division Kazan bacterium]
MYYLYVIINEGGKTYVGQTNNLSYRIALHNSNKVASTKNKGPWQIVHKEIYPTGAEAMSREKYFKQGAGYRYLKELTSRGVA